MSQQKFLNPNRIWFTIVLLHIVGSVLDSVLAILPFGRIIAAIAIWFFLANIQEKNIRRIEICIAGCIITIFMMYSLDISYQGTILLNELLLLYVFWELNFKIIYIALCILVVPECICKASRILSFEKSFIKEYWAYYSCCDIFIYHGRLCKCLFYDRISELIR